MQVEGRAQEDHGSPTTRTGFQGQGCSRGGGAG